MMKTRKWVKLVKKCVSEKYTKFPSTMMKTKKWVKLVKKYILVLIFLLAALLLVIYYKNLVEQRFYQHHMQLRDELLLQDITATCHLPDYQPFEPTVLRFLKSWPAIKCGSPQLPLTFLDTEGVLHVNKSAARLLELKACTVSCKYREVIRAAHTDDNYTLGPPQVINDAVKLDLEFLVVQCFCGRDRQLVYETGHARVRPLETSLAARSHRARKSGAHSVLIVGIDSMSRLNFIRQLPRTYEVLTRLLNATVIKGLNKVGDNTFPNMIVMMSGLAAKSHSGTMKGPFWNTSHSEKSFDTLPAVWKNYTERGHVTMFAEDLPYFAMFNYLSMGFFDPPTHYYMRPFWLAMDKQVTLVSEDSRCYGHVPKHQLLMNYTEDFLKEMWRQQSAFFAFTFYTLLSHDYLNGIQVVDGEFADQLTRYHASGFLDDTILVVLGDHGNRFDAIRSTPVGRVEERMPFFAVSLPASLAHLRPGLTANENVLTSWHDVYELLMDVADDNLDVESKQVRYGYRGLSLLRPIPSNRTCDQVGIPQVYCVCADELELDPAETMASTAGASLVAHVNAILPQECATLQLQRVENAQLIVPSTLIVNPTDLKVHVRVVVSVNPSGAKLEGTLEQGAWSSDVIGEVNRINKYGNQSFCVHDKVLQMYCYCKEFL